MLLQIAVRIPMHLDAVGRTRDMGRRAIYLVLGLGEGRGAWLAIWRHGEVIEVTVPGRRNAVPSHTILVLLPLLWLLLPRRGVARLLRYRRGEVGLQMLDIERVGQLGELLSRVVLAAGGIVNGEVQVEVIEVDEAAKVVVCGRADVVKLLCARPRCGARVVDVHPL